MDIDLSGKTTTPTKGLTTAGAQKAAAGQVQQKQKGKTK